MAIQQSRQQSDLEKRLQILRRQVYGKERIAEPSSKSSLASNYKLPTTNPQLQSNKSSAETAFLRNDLLKIATLSSLAIGAEVIFYFLFKNNILRLNIF